MYKIQEYSRNWLQQLNRMSLMDYREYLKKTTDQQTEETRETIQKRHVRSERVNKLPNSMLVRWWWCDYHSLRHVVDLLYITYVQHNIYPKLTPLTQWSRGHLEKLAVTDNQELPLILWKPQVLCPFTEPDQESMHYILHF